MLENYGSKMPSPKCLYYPGGFYVQSSIAFAIYNFFLHLIPALIGDAVFKLAGKEPV